MSMEDLLRGYESSLSGAAKERAAAANRRASQRERPYIPAYDAGPKRRRDWNIQDYNWYGRDTARRYGVSDADLQRAYETLSDVDRIRAKDLGPAFMLREAGIPFTTPEHRRPTTAPGAPDFGPTPTPTPPGSGPGPGPVPPPPLPTDPIFDPLPPPPPDPEAPPEASPIPPTPPPFPWIPELNTMPSIPGPAPPMPVLPPFGGSMAPPAPLAPPAPPAPPVSSPYTAPAPRARPLPGGSIPGPDPGYTTGPGPYPPYLGGQPTWGNPTDPHLLPFTPGSILPPGRGGQPPWWWNEVIPPSPLAPPGFPSAARNPFYGNTGGYNVGSPYYAPMSTWGFYPMPFMGQHMPGSYGAVTPGMGSWFSGAPLGFNPTPGFNKSPPGITNDFTPANAFQDFSNAFSQFSEFVTSPDFSAFGSPMQYPYNYMQQGAPRLQNPSMYVSQV